MGNNFSGGQQHAVAVVQSRDEWRAIFEPSKKSDTLMVVNFSVTWREPCQYMDPVFKSLSKSYKDVEFVYIDVNDLPDVANKLGVEVNAVPTFVFFKRGKEVDRLVGAYKSDLKDKIIKHRKRRG